MKIRSIEAIPYEITMKAPLLFASGAMEKADHVLIRITTDDGIIGIADVPPRPYTYGETQGSVVSVVDNIFAPALIGKNPLARNQVQAVLKRTIGNHTAKGAIDIALWDIIGKHFNTSVHQLLGGFASGVRASHMLGFEEPSQMVEEALRYRESYGITSFKVKVGRRPVQLDLDVCVALREALGPSVDLYMDANRGWHGSEAMFVARALADMNFLYFEEPTDALEVMSRRKLVTDSPITIFADESVPTLGDVARELVNGGASGISIKTARTGFTESQKILGLCEGMGVDVIMGNQIDSMLGSYATVAFGAAFELSSRRAAELSNFLEFGDSLAIEELEIVDGAVSAPTRPGVGASLDEAKLAKYRTDGK